MTSHRVASGVILTAALPFAGILSLSVAEFHLGLTCEQIVFFYALPALSLAALGASLRLGGEARLNVALSLVSVGLAVLMAEVLAGFALRTPRLEATDSRPPLLESVLAARDRGDHAFPRMPGNGLVNISPVFVASGRILRPVGPGPANAHIMLCNENGPLVSYQSDWLGFNNPEKAWVERDASWALVGDSYVHGVCVPEEEQLATRLRTRRPVLNFGVSGAGPLQELAILREYVAPLQPPVVVWVYYEGNDRWDLSQERHREWLLEYLDPTHHQDLLTHRKTVDEQYRTWVDSLVAHGHAAVNTSTASSQAGFMEGVVRLASLRRLLRFGVLFPTRESSLGLLPEVLRRARDDVASWAGRFYVAYMPAYARYETAVGEGVAGRRELIEFLNDNGIPLIDLHTAFVETQNPKALWAQPRGHLNAAGYQVAAEAIADEVGNGLH